MNTDTPIIEATLREAVSAERLQGHLERFSTLLRDSGTPDERAAAEYLRELLTGYGLSATILEFDSLISWPRAGMLTLLDDGTDIVVRTRSFGASTPAGGVEAELVFVPFAQPGAGEMIFSHRAVAGDYSGLDVAGKIVLTMDGGPDGIRRAQERGAAGHVHIWPSDEPVVHEMIGTSVWGTPTPASALRLPTIPVLGLTLADGDRLRERCAAGAVRVRMTSDVLTEWMRVPLLVADLAPGAADSDDLFLLVGAHIDSWYEGITDNATGDAALLEMARVLAGQRAQLRHGVRFAWWPGHSTGRYSGSTWYVDTHFMELRERCVGYLNVDSPGVRETSVWDCRYNMGEIEHITREVVQSLSGQAPNIRRPLKAGDQSCLGVGLPSLGAFRMLAAGHPDRKAVGGSGGAWWWHTPADTLDKADANLLAEDTRIYVTLAARLCLPAALPYNFVPAATDFVTHLNELQEVAGQLLDLTPVIKAANAFQQAAQRQAARGVGAELTRHNATLLRVTRIINPALFTIDGPYEMDPALQLPVLPGLAPMRELATLDPTSSAQRFLRTQLVRQRNRVQDALAEATRTLDALSP